MTTSELAKHFTSLLKSHAHDEAADTYNADAIVSYEAMDGPMAELHGKDAVKQKGIWWYENHDIHAMTVTGPFVNGDGFALHFTVDVTYKVTGERMAMQEVGVYVVDGGKIVSERFYPLVG